MAPNLEIGLNNILEISKKIQEKFINQEETKSKFPLELQIQQIKELYDFLKKRAWEEVTPSFIRCCSDVLSRLDEDIIVSFAPNFVKYKKSVILFEKYRNTRENDEIGINLQNQIASLDYDDVYEILKRDWIKKMRDLDHLLQKITALESQLKK
ncbi:MAG: hypothetical protein WC662_00700 [Candidatus Paceibacterota bacterium]